MRNESSCYDVKRGISGSPVPQDNLRLELNPNEFTLLSYHHFETANFKLGKDGDTLTISFLNRQVLITGKNLRPLALSLQDREVTFIKSMPGRYGLVLEDKAVLVETIKIEDEDRD